MKKLMIAILAGVFALAARGAGELSDLGPVKLSGLKLPLYNKQNLQMMVFCTEAERPGRLIVGYDVVIDLIRQFYDEPRKFRISGDMGQEEFVTFDNRGMGDQAVVNFGVETVRRPIFDIKVTAEKASPFSTVSQNELAKELYGMGFFNPQLADQALAALDMMDFEGRDMIRRKIQQNGTMYQQMQMMAQQMQQMAAIIDAQNGTTIAQGMAAEGVGQQVTPTGNVSGGSDKLIDAYGGLSNASKNSTAGQARARAAEAATPR